MCMCVGGKCGEACDEGAAEVRVVRRRLFTLHTGNAHEKPSHRSGRELKGVLLCSRLTHLPRTTTLSRPLQEGDGRDLLGPTLSHISPTLIPLLLLLQEMGENLLGAIFSFTEQLAQHPDQSSDPAQVTGQVPEQALGRVSEHVALIDCAAP